MKESKQTRCNTFYTLLHHISLVSLIFTATIQAQTTQELYAQANTAYQNNECASALKLYEQITSKGAATWYNMGNCAFKLNDQIKALLYWQRAYKDAHSELKKNITTNMTRLTITHTGPIQQTSAGTMQILFFCIFGIFLIVGYFLVRARRWIFLACSIAVLVSVARITYHVSCSSRQASVMQDNSALRAGPGHEYHQLDTLAAGITVTLLKQRNGWMQIKSNGTKGWIEDKQIEQI